jgi:hypothetical protein
LATKKRKRKKRAFQKQKLPEMLEAMRVKFLLDFVATFSSSYSPVCSQFNYAFTSLPISLIISFQCPRFKA